MTARGPLATTLAATLVLILVLPGCMGSSSRTQWAFTMTQLDQIEALGATGQGVTVAVIDSGIDPRHAALKHLVDGDEANGELIAFKDFLGGQSGVGAAFDDDGHGTHVSGIIAAQGSSLGDKLSYNGVSLLGGAPHVRLIVARVCQRAEEGSATCDGSKLASAIDWSVASGARVVSLSLGGAAGTDLLRGINPSDVERSVKAATDKGVVVVAAAGNTCAPDAKGCSECSDVTFPADIPSAIAVGSVSEGGDVSSFSCHGDDAAHPCNPLPPLNQLGQGRCDPDKKPEILAPGDGILSSWLDGSYAQASGTSQATPFVAATIALLLEHHAPLRSAGDVQALKQVLESTARPVPGQRAPHDDAAGYGILQAREALRAFTGT